MLVHIYVCTSVYIPPGPVKMRRINGEGMNVGVSNFLADLLEPIASEMSEKAEKGSTEAVLSEGDKSLLCRTQHHSTIATQRNGPL